ncbi:MAG: HPr family phosphocarrier protein [Gemmataceae bacterium]
MNGEPLRRNVLIANPHGFHMRPMAAFARRAEDFQSTVTVYHEGRSVNGKSIWDLMLLGAPQGCELTIEADGPDAPQAIDALAAILGAPAPEGN